VDSSVVFDSVFMERRLVLNRQVLGWS